MSHLSLVTNTDEHLLKLCVTRNINSIKMLDLSKLENHFRPALSNASAFNAFCEKYKIHYYARPNHSFLEFEGIREARRAGSEYLILENLS